MAFPQQQSRIKIDRRQGQNQFFEESLPGGIGLRMMAIPAGTFLMGSPDGELERLSREGPQHEVTVKAFFMGKFPVTQAQWWEIAKLPKVERELNSLPAYFSGKTHPIEQVSWYAATEFCARLSAYTKRNYRLPTEAEWEYACRAGTTTPFHFGETITTDLANYRGTPDASRGWSGSYGFGPEGEDRQRTTPVDYFGLANAFGLCDMHGNVMEWCQDHWHSSYRNAPTDGAAWVNEEGKGGDRILRGGSWSFDPDSCRSAHRISLPPDYIGNYIGFRVVCTPPRSVLNEAFQVRINAS